MLKTRTISDFVKQLGTAMSADFMLVPVERQVAKPQTLIRLDRKYFHRLGSLPPTPKKLRPRRDCKVCYDKMASSGEKKRCRETGFWCVVCEMDPKALIDDEVYKCLKNTFLVCGKGRRPDLPPDVRNNRANQKVLVQLYYLREDDSKPWSEVEGWMLKMFPGSNLQRGRVRYLIKSVHAQFLKAEDKISFLAMVSTLTFCQNPCLATE
ncbi:hypothetical protein RRG08_041641 [Elysia crispata]|uniref:Uncharacterized protein n=1 Tax=Elysia crispata TaxID=231223 RepID=A0AAE0YBV6_9GAST|nr:hypothetical protein RRG08_041641 [Elysia crispata]